ncbi:MAG: hypothetical protein JSW21_05755 [Gammaproteobacteria bacterium]|jgi:hypothetical protein|nr:MAG: hypothetical protein JSW21_05755 [Gammaproteobacteria bacterium]
MAVALPIIGDWYKKPTGELFEVVAIDHSDGGIEIQDFDGTIEEVESEAWFVSAFVRAAPPEDFSGSLDMEAEDTGLETGVAGHKEWTDPLEYLDKSE